MKIQQADTAIEHFHSNRFAALVSRQEAEILEHMKVGKDYTITELAYLTKLDKSTVSGRRNAMLGKGLIVQGKRRKCKFTEIHVQTVRLPQDMSV